MTFEAMIAQHNDLEMFWEPMRISYNHDDLEDQVKKYQARFYV